MSELNYKLVQIPQTNGAFAEVIRDDINGAILAIASGTIGVHIKIADLVAYINKAEAAKAEAAKAEEGVDFDKVPVA